MDHELADVIVANESGKSIDGREEFTRVLSMLRGGVADGLLVLKIDRLTRSVADGLRLLDEFFGERSRLGLTLVSAMDFIDTSTAQGRFLFTLQLSIATLERETTGERTSRALQFKMRNGEKVSSRLPYGQKPHPTEPKKTVPCPEELAVIEKMKAMYADGMSYGAIALHLNKTEVPTKTGQGVWQGRTVSRILQRDASRSAR